MNLKLQLLIIFTISSISFGIAQATTYMTVVGSCTLTADGLYDYNGDVNGKPSYLHDAGGGDTFTIYWDGSQWVNEDKNGNIGMTNANNTSYPPGGAGSGWVAGVCSPPGHFGGSTTNMLVSNSCTSNADGDYYYNGDVNGKPSYLHDASGGGQFTIYWDGSQWINEDNGGSIGMTNASSAFLPPCGSNSGWIAGLCNPPGDFGGPECYMTVENSCVSMVDDVYEYTGDINGKPSYFLDAIGSNTFTIYWDGSQWVNEDNIGGIGMSNSNNTATPPCGSWTPGICNPAGNFAGTACSSVLPIELLSFSSYVLKEEINLIWTTASETNNEKFEIEKSQDGREFLKIGTVQGSGTTVEENKYSFEVKNPRNGISYYRLKQIDFDGQFEYSKVISINFKGENGEVGQFYPNPSKSGIVNLEYTSKTDEEITISVFGVTGKLIVNQIQQISNGDNNLSFNFSDLNTGIYIVKIGDKSNPIHRKLIIER